MKKLWRTLEKKKRNRDSKQRWAKGEEGAWGVVDGVHIHTEGIAPHHIHAVGSEKTETHRL